MRGRWSHRASLSRADSRRRHLGRGARAGWPPECRTRAGAWWAAQARSGRARHRGFAMPRTIVGRGDESELYLLHHERLVRAVARVVNAPAALVEDACQTAWLVLLHRQPDRGPTLFGWLRTVAMREAYRLSREERRHARLEDLAEGAQWEALVGEGPSLEDAVEARRALAVLAALPQVQREDLALFV